MLNIKGFTFTEYIVLFTWGNIYIHITNTESMIKLQKRALRRVNQAVNPLMEWEILFNCFLLVFNFF